MILLLIAFICITLITLNSCFSKPSTAYVEEAVLASDIDQNQQPLGIANEFTMDQETIYCFVKVSDVQKETKVSTRWILKEGDLEGKGDIEFGYFERSIAEPGTIPFGISKEQDLLFPRGNCEVIISIDNQEVKTAPFIVEKPPSPKVDILPGTGYSPSSTEIIPKTFSWNYQGENYTLTLNFPKSLYDFYRLKKRVFTSDPQVYSLYVTHPNDDEVFAVLASAFKQYSLEKGFNAKECGEFMISFVRSLPYITDLESTSYDDRPNFPLETLFDGRGDCEDSSILLASILRAAGMSPVLLISPGHCAVGIAGEGGLGRKFYEYNGEKYYYVEATKCELWIGQVPSIFNPDDFNVVPLDPVPIVAFNFDEFRMGRVFRVSVPVNNTGSIPVHNIKVIATIISEKNEIVSNQETKPFSLSVNGEAYATFYLDCPVGGKYRLFVKTEWDNESDYILDKYITCP